MEASHNGIPPGGEAATKTDVQTAENNAKAYADGLVVGLFDDRGNYDASVNTFPASGGSGAAGAIKKGDVWLISVAGTLGGSAVEVGDMIRSLIDAPGQTAGNWTITERNLGYVPENAANKDVSGGYAGLTAFKINFKNAANTFMSFFTNTNTAARTYTFQDRDGTIADNTDLALKAPLASPTFTGTVTVPAPVNPTDAATKSYTDGLIVGLYDDRGNYDASVNTFPASGGSGSAGAVAKGDVWMIGVAGTLGGVAVGIGDTVRALIDSPGQTAGNWAITEGNLGYTPQNIADKDASGGYVGLEGYKINLWNAAKTFKTMLSSLASATRDAVFPDASGNVAFSGYNNVVTISNLASGGVIGTAANTVDKGLPIQINQTTTAQILTLPTPTNSTSYLLQPVTIPSGGGNVQSLMYGATLIPGLTNLYCYSGGSWNFVGGSVPKHFSGAPASTINPADASTFYFGAQNFNAQTINNESQAFYVASAGTITSAMVRMWADSVVGTAESISVYIRVNDTTDYLVAAVGSATAARVFSNTGLNIPVASGDTFSFKVVFPTWATNPTVVSFTARVVVS